MTMARQKRESGFKTNPDYKVTFEPSPRRVRVKFDGETIADSTNAHLLFETRHLPVYYFPRSDVRFDLMTETDHHTFCPYKGTASYWTIAVGDKVAENAVWGYPDPFDEVVAIKDSVAFYWDRVDAWYEEDEEIFVHPRDPYKRVDVLELLPPGAGRRRRQSGSRNAACAVPVRDAAADPLLHPTRGCAHGPSGPERQSHPLPLQGQGTLLLDQNRRQAVRRPGVDLPRSDP